MSLERWQNSAQTSGVYKLSLGEGQEPKAHVLFTYGKKKRDGWAMDNRAYWSTDATHRASSNRVWKTLLPSCISKGAGLPACERHTLGFLHCIPRQSLGKRKENQSHSFLHSFLWFLGHHLMEKGPRVQGKGQKKIVWRRKNGERQYVRTDSSRQKHKRHGILGDRVEPSLENPEKARDGCCFRIRANINHISPWFLREMGIIILRKWLQHLVGGQ